MLSVERRQLLERLLKQKGIDFGAGSTIPKRPPGGPEPLSFAQQRLWFLDQLEPGNPAYNLFGATRLTGPLNAGALRQALDAIVSRHESLRTTFATRDGQPVQVISAHVALELPVVDVGPAEAERFAAEEAVRPYDLERGPLVRFGLVRLGEEEHLFLLGMHHIISDGWSLGVFVRELGQLYEAYSTGRPPTLPDLPIQYADFAAWQRGLLSGDELERQLSYWREKLDGAPAVLPLPSDRPRPAMQTFRGARVTFGIERDVTDGLKALARAHDASLFMVLVAAVATLLQRYTAQDDVVIGSPIAGRSRAEIEGLIGFFVNTLVLRNDLSGDPSFVELLERVRETALGAYAHADLPFEKLVAELHPERDLSHTPLFQVMFALQDALGEPLELAGLTLTQDDVDSGTAKFDLTIQMIEDEEGLFGDLEYNTDLFDRSTAERLAGHLEVVLGGVVVDANRRLSQLPLLTDAELEELQQEPRWAPATPVHHRFEEHARTRPDAVAITCGHESLTYAQLDAAANRLAHHLIELGAGPGVPVAVCLERGPGLVTAILAVLKAGSHHVPIDPAYPEARRRFLVADSAARVVVTDDVLEGAAAHPATRPHIVTEPDDLAYVIYTSGSTGEPKGVMVTHRNVARLFTATDGWFGFGPDDVWTLFHSFAFDFSVWELWGALAYGGRLVVVPYWVTRSPESFLDLLAAERVTVLNQTPSAFQQLSMVDDGRAHLSLRYVIFGGEALEPVSKWIARRGDERPRLVNMYGITETTVHVTYRPITAADTGSPIGVPIPDLTAHVLDRHGNLVPTGVIGEIYVGGAGVARGYLNRPDLTAERFVPDPWNPGGRLYRSGDLARRRPSGDLEYVGRSDDQVKVRGFRIEVGEIEAALAAHPAVAQAAVVADEHSPGHRRLVAYVSPEHVDVTDVRAFLADRLPDYMLPAAVVVVPTLPLTANGKVDRRALPRPGVEGRRYSPPRTPEEEALAAVWAEVLGLERVGVDDNYFELGGDSILSIQVIAAAARRGLRLTPKQIFQHQTVAEQARVAARAGAPTGDDAEQGPVSGPMPLTPIQRWFFALGSPDPHHYNQSVLLEVPASLDREALRRALHAVVSHHDALRLCFRRGPEGWEQSNAPPPELDGIELMEEADWARVQASHDLESGLLLRAALLPTRLLLSVHHLAVDAVSWPILLADLELAYRQAAAGEPPLLPPKTTSFKTWAEGLAGQHEVIDEPGGRLDLPEPGTEGEASRLVVALDEHDTAALLTEVPAAYRTQINDALLTALAQVLARRTGTATVLVDLEGHGRDERVDLSRTVGWFTTISPVVLEGNDDVGAALKAVKEELRAPRRVGTTPAQVAFNYLGRMGGGPPGEQLFVPAPEGRGPERSPRTPRSHALNIDAAVIDGRFEVAWTSPAGTEELVRELAQAYLDALRGVVAHCRAGAFGYTPSDFPLAGLDQSTVDRLFGADPGIDDVYPLTPMQQGMLFHTLLEPESGVYFEQGSFLVEGPLDEAAFSGAWERVIERHPILRTSVVAEGVPRPLQVVHRRVPLPLTVVDWSEVRQQQRLDEFLASERARGFDLAAAPLLRLTLVRLGPDRHQFVWSFHHLLLDGWSVGIVFRELLFFYDELARGRQADLPAVPRYRDYIAWLEAQDLAEAGRHWRELLAGFTAPTALAVDHAPSGVESGVGLHTAVLGAEALAILARSHRVTVNTVVQGAWALLLSRYSGDDDVVFGATVSGRSAPVPGVESMVGLFINTLPVRVAVDDRAHLGEWLGRLQEQQAELRHLEHSPLVEVQARSDVRPGVPLFESILVFENYPIEAPLAEPEGGASRLSISGSAVEQTNYPLTVAVVPGAEFKLLLSYDRRRFDAGAIERLAGHLLTLLAAMAAAPGARLADLPLLAESERREVLALASGGPGAGPGLVHHLVEAQAAARPHAPAVVAGDDVLSYGEVEAHANRLAHHLRTVGAGPEVVVGICVERGPHFVVAALAALKAGAAYLPLDPDYPPARLEFLLADSGAPLLVTTAELARRLPAHGARVVCLDDAAVASQPTQPPAVDVDPANLAYVIYTSGSTGTPKGVMIEHRGLPNLVEAQAAVLDPQPGERVLQFSSIGFDAATFEMLTALAHGGTLHMASRAELLPGRGLVDRLRDWRINTFLVPPSALAVMPEDELPDLRTLAVAAEACPPGLVSRWGEGRRVFNLYGPTEVTVWSVAARLDPDDEGTPPIGRPVPGITAYVLDRRLEPVPVGVPGELYLGGIGVGRGYLNRPDLTAERFIPCPWGGRLYRSGDVVRWRPDGGLDFLGRVDDQVKVRGFRIELGEVEAALASHPGVRAAAAAARPDVGLVAYVVAADPDLPLREFLLARLPEYMVPSVFVNLDALPVNPHGKLDRRALPDPVPSRSHTYVAPRTPLEETVASTWAEVLGVEKVGAHDNFFELGGHSLLATLVASRLSTDVGVEVPLRLLFERPTVADLAGAL